MVKLGIDKMTIQSVKGGFSLLMNITVGPGENAGKLNGQRD